MNLGNCRLSLWLVVVLSIGVTASANAAPTDFVTRSAIASSSISGWDVSYAYDGVLSTAWSSQVHNAGNGGAAQSTESLSWKIDANQTANYVKVGTRMSGGNALGFPVEFDVYSCVTLYNGLCISWKYIRGFTHYPRPGVQWVTLPLLTNVSSVTVNWFKITTRVLGDDMYGSYVFQVAEIKAGFDPDLGFVEYIPSSAMASTTLGGWPTTNAYDNDPPGNTSWSSSLHSSAGNSEYLAYWWPAGKQNINYVKVKPRYQSNNALCFPSAFQIYYSNGAQWISTGVSHTNYPTPHSGDWIILPLPTTVFADGIQIFATTLGSDGVGNYALQFADVRAGYDPGFNQFTFVSNDGSTLRNEIRNVGSESINRTTQIPACLQPLDSCNWHRDDRGVVIAPDPGPVDNRNIYSPQIVYTGGKSWNVYFHGWDGSPTKNDRIYMTTTADNFLSFACPTGLNCPYFVNYHSNHALAIDHGEFTHVGNESVFKVADNDWRMAYTTYAYDGSSNGGSVVDPSLYTCNNCPTNTHCGDNGLCYLLNKPAYARSTDGLHWTPSSGTVAKRIGIANYGRWDIADINGVNVIFREPNGNWHIYIQDSNPYPPTEYRNQHATSTEGPGDLWASFTTPQVLSNPSHVISDLRSFTYGGTTAPSTTFYVGAYREDINTVWFSIDSTATNANPLSNLSTIQPAFISASDAPDQSIVNVGWIQDGSRLYGALYGAGSDPVNKGNNQIYARWLQKKVLFKTLQGVTWGDIENGYGPDTVRLDMGSGDAIETGNFYVYDTDGTTLLYVSPTVTMRQGDIWRYNVPITPYAATASGSFWSTPYDAFDKNSNNWWTASTSAPGWIELDMGKAITIKKIRLLLENNPGTTTSQIYIGTTPNPPNLAAVITGVMSKQWLTVDFAQETSGRYIRINTSSSPNWPAWNEIEVYQ